MLFAQTGDNLLMRFCVICERKGSVFLQQPQNPLCDFAFIPLCLRHDCHRVTWRVVLRTFQRHSNSRTKGIPGCRIHFCSRSNISCHNLLGFFLFLTAHIHKFADFFRLAGSHVDNLHSGRHCPGCYLDIGKLSNEGVRNSFKDLCHQRCIRTACNLHRIAVRFRSNRLRFLLFCREEIRNAV